MAPAAIRDFHAHIYYNLPEVERAKALAAELQRRFGVAVGHFHLRPPPNFLPILMSNG